MRKKLQADRAPWVVFLPMALALTVAPWQAGAQTQFYTVTNFPGWNLIANQLDKTNGNNINNVIPSAPPGSYLYKWTGAGYQPEYFDDVDLVWVPGVAQLNPGDGLLFYNASAANYLLTFSGVPHAPALPVNLGSGMTLLARQTNGPGTFTNILGFNPVQFSALYRFRPGPFSDATDFSPTNYTQYVFRTNSGWSPGAPAVSVGESVWITTNGAVNILAQPLDQSVCPGGTAVFSVNASGAPPLSYQWRLNGNNISGATASTYSIQNVQLINVGNYSVMVTDVFGAVPSVTASLNMNVSSSALISRTNCSGTTATFATVPSGTGPFTFQWTKDGNTLFGATDNSYSTLVTGTNDEGNYCVVVSSPCNLVTNCATLTVACTNANNVTSFAAGLPDLHLSKAGMVNAMLVQPDGQMVIGGSFTSVNDVPLRNLARINNAGDVDTVWAPNPDGPVLALALATSGTNVFVGGTFQNIGGVFRNGLASVGTSGGGEVDPVWAPLPDSPAVFALQLSGPNLFVGGAFDVIGQQLIGFGGLAKVDAAGLGDADPAWIPQPNAAVYALAMNGTDLYAGGSFTTIGGFSINRLAKLTTAGTGTVDSNWNPNIDAFNNSTNSSVSALLLTGTNLFIGGSFTNVAGFARAGLAKLVPTGFGAVDFFWNPQPISTNSHFVLAASGSKMLVGGTFSAIGGQNLTNIARLSISGSGNADTNWAPSVNGPVGALLVNGSWLFVGGGFSLVNSSISLALAKIDVATATSDDSFFGQVGSPGQVNALARQRDGRVIAGGDFWMSGLTPRPHLARINADGTLDSAWAPATDGPVNALGLNGTNLFVGGAFSNISRQKRNGLAKVDISGTDLVDTSWNPGLGSGAAVNALATDGTNVYVGGANMVVAGQPNLSLAKFTASGSAMYDFNWNAVADAPVFALGLDQSSLFVGGSFNNIRGLARSGLARFDLANGSLDASWDAGLMPVGSVAAYALAVGGTNLFVAGSFNQAGGQLRSSVAKINPLSGSVDPVWSPSLANFPDPAIVYALNLSGGYLYAGGGFGTNPMNLARLSPVGQGAVDLAWHPNPGNGSVRAILPVGADVYIGGDFETIENAAISGNDVLSRNGFALLAVGDPPVIIQRTPTNFVIVPNAADGPEITWFRILGVTGGTVFLSDGTPVFVGEFITVSQGAAGLSFSGGNGSITVAAAFGNSPSQVGATSTTLNFGAPGLTVLSFSSRNYSADEDGGAVIVSVRKQGSGPVSVNYATVDGSAVAGNDYVPAFGTLNFTATETNKDISIPILNDSLFEGNESFSISLSSPTGGAVLGYPATATITIVESTPIGSIASSVSSAMPGALPPATGVLTVTLQPANAQWRLAGEGVWHNSGALVSNLVSGNYRVEFLPMNGYRPPDAMIAPVVSDTTLPLAISYLGIPTVPSGVGYISLLVCPDNIGGQWHLQGDLNWYNSGDAVTNLPPGTYTVEFSSVPGWVTPEPSELMVYRNEGTRITGHYEVTNEGIGTAPLPVSFSVATTVAPYAFAGQIQTDVGFGTGTAVKDGVVLTAASLVFDSDNLTYVSRARWFFQRSAGRYEPVPQLPRGWHVFSPYSDQIQTNPNTCIEGPQTRSLDLAAMYFMQSAGRGGYSGYLISGPTNYLTSNRPKLLAGYAMEVVSPANQGKLLATDPSNISFTPVSSNLFYTANISGYPGLRGGALFVQGDNNGFYPAGIYLGPSQSSNLVRVLDADAADLINRATLSAVSKLSDPGPIMFQLTATTNQFGFGGTASDVAYLQINTGPQAALDKGGGWLLSGSPIVYHGTNDAAPIRGQSTVSVLFQCIGDDSFAVPYRPPDQTIQVSAGATYIVDMPYLPPPSRAFSVSLARDNLAGTSAVTLLHGVLNYTYQIEYADVLPGPLVWSALSPVVITTDDLPVVFSDTSLGKSRFYRARWVTCPSK